MEAALTAVVIDHHLGLIMLTSVALIAGALLALALAPGMPPRSAPQAPGELASAAPPLRSRPP